MEEMDSRYQQQQTTSLEIDTLGNNFKKDAPARKTKAYLQRRIAALDDKWACFQSIHAELQQLAETFHTCGAHFHKGRKENMRRSWR